MAVIGSEDLRHIYKAGEDGIGPASIDLTLQGEVAIPIVHRGQTVKLGDRIQYRTVKFTKDRPYILMPGEFVLGATVERVDMPLDKCGFVQGRSSIGRIGLTVQNAGFIDPGFTGTITLEIVNEAKHPIALIPGYRVVQIVYMDVLNNAIRYEGKYNGQVLPTGSRMHMDREVVKNDGNPDQQAQQ